MKMNRRTRALWAMIVLAGLTAIQPAIGQDKWGYKKKTDGTWTYVDRMEYRRANDSYLVVRGGTMQYEVARNEVGELAVPKPSDFDKFAQGLVQPMPDPASIAGMESIVQKYACMKWDVEGLTWLIPAYTKRQDDEKILNACKDLEKMTGQVPEALLAAYWTALSKKGQAQSLKVKIEEAIEKGSRGVAAAAYIVRGDILVQEGKKKEALTEGYLRVVILFNDVKRAQPEALYKTWQTMSSLNDKRSERFKRKLLDEYADSQYASSLK